jgi:hypothetical protein
MSMRHCFDRMDGKATWRHLVEEDVEVVGHGGVEELCQDWKLDKSVRAQSTHDYQAAVPKRRAWWDGGS